ncbi:hypothetical protein DFH09DRAFT_1369086 [Mycena vulgaris]|nr:hypothetical protein DFH09DRAFT_1369086 [Mycena vulgaris]
MPMPFLKRGSPPPPPSDASVAQTPRKRRFSLPSLPTRPATRPTHRKRNSLILPEVPMLLPSPPSSSPSARTSSCTLRPSCTTRHLPPPLAARTVRFVLPPPKFAPPIDWPGNGDEEPAWSDFMGDARTGEAAMVGGYE